MLREKKKRETREAIADVALELFVQHGFDAITVEQIADAAAVSRRTVFRYFDSKESLLFASQEARMTHFRTLLEHREWGDTPLAAVRAALLDMARLYMEEREVILALHRIIESSSSLMAYDQRLDVAWEAAIIEALVVGTNDPDSERHRQARWLAGALVGTVRVVLRDWVRANGTDDLVELGRQALGFVRFKGWE